MQVLAAHAVGLLQAGRTCRGVFYRVAGGKVLIRIQRAERQQTRRAAAQVRLNVCSRYRIRHLGSAFQSPLLDGAINLTEVVDAHVLLRSRTRLQEVGNRDRSQEADNGHHNHDFHQRETHFAGRFDFHTVFHSALGGVNTRQVGYHDFSLCPLIACRYHFVLNQAAPMPKPTLKGGSAFQRKDAFIGTDVDENTAQHCKLLPVPFLQTSQTHPTA